jgi:hypothetical protein
MSNAPFVPKTSITGSRFPTGYLPKAAVGRDGERRLAARKRNCNCMLLGYCSEEHKDPWLVLTDLAPECADACWYSLRAWIEQGFKRSKRNGWQWQHTRMDDPLTLSAERLWIAIAIATWWLLFVGGEGGSTSRYAVGHHRTFGTWRSMATRKTLADGRYFPSWLVFN